MNLLVGRSFCLLVFSLFFITSVAFCQKQPVDLDLEIKLVNPAALGLDSTASAQNGIGLSFMVGSAGGREIKIEIVTEEIVIDSQAQAKRFLSENGIRPDANAESLVYYLNPDLASIREIGKGTTLQLPVLRIPAITNERELPKQPIIAVLLDPQLKGHLRETVDSFRRTVKNKRKDFIPQIANALKSVNLSLDRFYADDAISSHQMLEQVHGETTTLISILDKYSRKSRWLFRKHPKISLSPEDLDQFNAIKNDLSTKLEESSRSNPDVKVLARTFKDKDEVSSFIVCYAHVALSKQKKCDSSFSQRSSPTNEQFLAIANYIFWAIRPEDGTIVSNIREYPVRSQQDGKPLIVDLTIK
jgi:hypothetical protein